MTNDDERPDTVQRELTRIEVMPSHGLKRTSTKTSKITLPRVRAIDGPPPPKKKP